jgi:transcriptional regulator with XRE-family HTH domain
MYPHEIDRLRVLQFIFKRLRKRHQVSQQDLAARAGVAQSVVSNLQNLVVTDEIKRPSRKNAISVLGYGLRLPPRDISALLWLFDRNPITDGEINRIVRSYDPSATTTEYDNNDTQLRGTVLRLLRETVTSEMKAKVKMRCNSDVTARLFELKEFLEYERRPGQRLFASTIPTSLVHPATSFQEAGLIPANIANAHEERRFLSLYRERQRVFLSNLKLYGERSIHPRSSLERYAKEFAGHSTPMPLRHQQIRNWIVLLREYPHFEVGLNDDAPLLELGVKTIPVALIRGLRQDRSRNNPIWGVHHIVWTDEDSVFSFILSFEHTWDGLSPDGRDKNKVILFLESLLL